MAAKQDKPVQWASVTILVVTVALWMFRVEDPYGLLLLCLLASAVGACMKFRFSVIDVLLGVICLYDLANWCSHPYAGIDNLYLSVACFFAYLSMRGIVARKRSLELFLKGMLFLIALVLAVVMFSFVFFAESVHEAGFTDIYPLRFLFTPLGYVTNAWSSVYLPVMGLLAVFYFLLPRWRLLVLSCYGVASVALFLSFSRGALLSWGIYVFLLLFLLQSWKEKCGLLVLSVCVCVLSWTLFPRETSTVVAMNRTVSQQLSTQSRFNATGKAMDACREHLWTGTGIGTYTLAVDKELNQDSARIFTSYAPNMFVQLLVERGIIGLVLHVCLYIVVAVECIRRRKEALVGAVAASLLALLMKEMTISILLDTAVVWLLAYMLLALLQNGREEEAAMFPSKGRYILGISGLVCFAVWGINGIRFQKHAAQVQAVIKAYGVGNYGEALERAKLLPDNLSSCLNKAMLGMELADTLCPAAFLQEVKIGLENMDTAYDAFASYIHARFLLRNGETCKAGELLERLVCEHPCNALYLYEKALLLYREGERKKAVIMFEKAITLYPRLLQLLQRHASPLWMAGSSLRERLLANILSASPETMTPNACARYGYLLYHMDEREKAFLYLQKAVEEQPGLATPWLLLGRIYEAMGNEETAEPCFKKYNLLLKGAFSRNTRALHEEAWEYTDSQLLFAEYAMKFREWYGCDLLF